MTLPILPEALRSAARAGRLNVLIGAGVSFDAGLPDWPNLLESIARNLDRVHHPELRRLMANERFLDAAQLLHDYLPASVIHDSLNRALNPVVDPSPLHDAVWNLAPPLVFTTNFDTLLEAAYFRKHRRPPVVVLGSDRSAVGSVRATGRICKLHGDLSSPSSIVLSRNQYYESVQQMAFGGGPWSQFTQLPCLAIGYSLRDPDIQLLLHWLDVSLRGYAQPIFLLTAETRPEELQLFRDLGAVHLIPYSIDSGHRKPLLDVLNVLASERASSEYVMSAAPAELVLLRRFRLEMRARLHNLRNKLGILRLNVESLELALGETLSLAGDLSGAMSDAIQALPAIEAEVDLLQRQSRASSQRLTRANWSSCREELIVEIGSARRELVTFETSLAELPNASLPIGPELYSTLVRILLDNAIDALINGVGRITITANCSTENGRQYLSTSVVDNGRGIEQGVAGTLFTPGASTKGPNRGEGLFLLRLAVEEAGGDVVLNSSPGRGTAVHFLLPIHMEQEEEFLPKDTNSATARPFSESVRVLVCDDNKEFLDSLVRTLSSLNCIVASESDPRRLLRCSSLGLARPDIIICDVVVGDGISGLDVVEAVRGVFPALPAVLISGYTDQRSVRSQNSRFLSKPFSTGSMRMYIGELLERD